MNARKRARSSGEALIPSSVLTRYRCDPENQTQYNMGGFSKRVGLARLSFAGMVLVFLSGLLAIALPASAALNLSIGNPGLQHFDSDGAVQLNFGLTGADSQPVGNLTAENVKVYEDGVLAKILDFRGVGQGRPVDIVFVMDVTESMQPYIDAVKQSMVAFAHDLAANNRDYRLGLVTFEDYTISKYKDCNCAYRDKLTSDVNEFVNWVGSLHASGGGDIPEDQLDALAYASTLPFRPNAQAILILITDAPCHKRGDGPDREGDLAYREHKNPNADVTNLMPDDVSQMLRKQGITLYAVAPPPFIEPAYADIVKTTHGRLYNIVTEEGRFATLVREIGHTIATEYSLSYKSPRPIEDGTNRNIELKIDYNGETADGMTSYQVRGVGGAAINPTGAGAGATAGESGLAELSFSWWNGAVPLVAILGLLLLSRMRFGLSAEELKAIVEAHAQHAHAPGPSTARAPTRMQAPAAPQPPQPPRPTYPGPVAPMHNSGPATLTTLNPVSPVLPAYTVLKDEVSLGRGEDNDIVIPHPSVSRTHARLLRRDGLYEIRDLNSTNGTFVDDLPVRGAASVSNGSRVRLGDVQFVLKF